MIRKSAKNKKLKRAKNPDTFYISDKEGNKVYREDVEIWMKDYMKSNPNYDPHAMSYKAGKYFNINSHFTKPLDVLAFDLAEEFEYNKERSRQRKASFKTKGFPLGLGNSPFKKKNPDGQIKPRGITLDEIRTWMLRYIKSNDDYDPRDMAKHAIIHLNIINLTPKEEKIIVDLAYKTADDYEMRRR